MKQTQYHQPTREANSLTIGAQSIEVEPSVFIHSSYPKGVCVRLTGYNPEAIVLSLLDDYGYERVIEMCKKFATESELSSPIKE